MNGLIPIEGLLLVLLLSLGVVALFHRLRIPSIAGFIVVGVVVGPHALSLLSSEREVEGLAKLGVVLLLFSIGLEFSINRLRRTWKILLEGGVPYVLVASAAAYAGARALGLPGNAAVFVAFWLALSSTAIVLKTLADRGEIDTPHGRLVVAILLFQDLCIVPMMLLLPILDGGSASPAGGVGRILAQSVLILLAILFVSRYVVPRFLAYVARTRNRELFFLLILLLCLGAAAGAHWLGLPAALGAFFGGLLLSKSDYGLQALSDILPFRDIFNSIFFMSIGMLLDLRFFVAHPVEVILLGSTILLAKAIVGVAITIALGFPARVAALAGIALANVGEFSFVLAGAGRGMGLLAESSFQLLLSASILTMTITPILIAAAPRMAGRMGRVDLAALVEWRTRRSLREGQPEGERMSDHVVVAGYGLNGRNLSRLLAMKKIPYLIVEMNAGSVREARRRGEPILYGDVTSKTVQAHLGLERARLLMISISDAQATRLAVREIRAAHPDLHILVRTRYVSEMDELRRIGADEVVPEEFETSIEICARALARYGTPIDQIRSSLEDLRADGYRTLRPLEPLQAPSGGFPLPSGGTATIAREVREGSRIAGLSLSELDLQGRTGAGTLAVIRAGQVMADPTPAMVLEVGDLLVLIGSEEQLDAARAVLEGEIALEGVPPYGSGEQTEAPA